MKLKALMHLERYLIDRIRDDRSLVDRIADEAVGKLMAPSGRYREYDVALRLQAVLAVSELKEATAILTDPGRLYRVDGIVDACEAIGRATAGLTAALDMTRQGTSATERPPSPGA